MERIILSQTFVPRVKHMLFVARIAFQRVAVCRLTCDTLRVNWSDCVVVKALLQHVYWSELLT